MGSSSATGCRSTRSRWVWQVVWWLALGAAPMIEAMAGHGAINEKNDAVQTAGSGGCAYAHWLYWKYRRSWTNRRRADANFSTENDIKGDLDADTRRY